MSTKNPTLELSEWHIIERRIPSDKNLIARNETIFTIGNGLLSLRGSRFGIGRDFPLPHIDSTASPEFLRSLTLEEEEDELTSNDPTRLEDFFSSPKPTVRHGIGIGTNSRRGAKEGPFRATYMNGVYEEIIASQSAGSHTFASTSCQSECTLIAIPDFTIIDVFIDGERLNVFDYKFDGTKDPPNTIYPGRGETTATAGKNAAMSDEPQLGSSQPNTNAYGASMRAHTDKNADNKTSEQATASSVATAATTTSGGVQKKPAPSLSNATDGHPPNVTQYTRALNLRNGELKTSFIFRSQSGHLVRIDSSRLVSFTHKGVAAIRLSATLLSSKATEVVFVSRTLTPPRSLNHLSIQNTIIDDDAIKGIHILETRTNNSRKDIVVACHETGITSYPTKGTNGSNNSTNSTNINNSGGGTNSGTNTTANGGARRTEGAFMNMNGMGMGMGPQQSSTVNHAFGTTPNTEGTSNAVHGFLHNSSGVHPNHHGGGSISGGVSQQHHQHGSSTGGSAQKASLIEMVPKSYKVENGVVSLASAYLGEGSTAIFEKLAAFASEGHYRRDDLVSCARNELLVAVGSGYEGLLAEQREHLRSFWSEVDIKIAAPTMKELLPALRLSHLQLYMNAGQTRGTSIATKGMCPYYGGQYSWDTEIVISPYFTYNLPHISKNFIQFRIDTLPQAMDRALELGLGRGAVYPWRTINGYENWPAVGGTVPLHINADIAFAIRSYYEVTHDVDMMMRGAGLVVMATALTFIQWGSWSRGVFHIRNVTGPDEYNILVNDNYYTNIMTQHCLTYAVDIAETMLMKDPVTWRHICEILRMPNYEDDLKKMRLAAEKMALPYDATQRIHLQDASFLNKKVGYPLSQHANHGTPRGLVESTKPAPAVSPGTSQSYPKPLSSAQQKGIATCLSPLSVGTRPPLHSTGGSSSPSRKTFNGGGGELDRERAEATSVSVGPLGALCSLTLLGEPSSSVHHRGNPSQLASAFASNGSEASTNLYSSLSSGTLSLAGGGGVGVVPSSVPFSSSSQSANNPLSMSPRQTSMTCHLPSSMRFPLGEREVRAAVGGAANNNNSIFTLASGSASLLPAYFTAAKATVPTDYNHPVTIYRHRICKISDIILAQILFTDRFTKDEKLANFEFYEQLTTHDVSASWSTFSIMAAHLGLREKAYAYFRKSLMVDIDDIVGNSSESQHIVSLAGSWACVVKGFGGMRVSDGHLSFNPWLPDGWTGYSFKVKFAKSTIAVSVSRCNVVYNLLQGLRLMVGHAGSTNVHLIKGKPVTIKLSKDIRSFDFDAIVIDLNSIVHNVEEDHYWAWKEVIDALIAHHRFTQTEILRRRWIEFLEKGEKVAIGGTPEALADFGVKASRLSMGNLLSNDSIDTFASPTYGVMVNGSGGVSSSSNGAALTDLHSAHTVSSTTNGLVANAGEGGTPASITTTGSGTVGGSFQVGHATTLDSRQRQQQQQRHQGAAVSFAESIAYLRQQTEAKNGFPFSFPIKLETFTYEAYLQNVRNHPQLFGKQYTGLRNYLATVGKEELVPDFPLSAMGIRIPTLSTNAIDLAYGSPADPPGFHTLHALANKKFEVFRQNIASRGGARLVNGARELIDDLRRNGIAVGCVSSSRNGEWLARQLGVGHLFDVFMDGKGVWSVPRENRVDAVAPVFTPFNNEGYTMAGPRTPTSKALEIPFGDGLSAPLIDLDGVQSAVGTLPVATRGHHHLSKHRHGSSNTLCGSGPRNNGQSQGSGLGQSAAGGSNNNIGVNNAGAFPKVEAPTDFLEDSGSVDLESMDCDEDGIDGDSKKTIHQIEWLPELKFFEKCAQLMDSPKSKTVVIIDSVRDVASTAFAEYALALCTNGDSVSQSDILQKGVLSLAKDLSQLTTDSLDQTLASKRATAGDALLRMTNAAMAMSMTIAAASPSAVVNAAVAAVANNRVPSVAASTAHTTPAARQQPFANLQPILPLCPPPQGNAAAMTMNNNNITVNATTMPYSPPAPFYQQPAQEGTYATGPNLFSNTQQQQQQGGGAPPFHRRTGSSTLASERNKGVAMPLAAPPPLPLPTADVSLIHSAAFPSLSVQEQLQVMPHAQLALQTWTTGGGAAGAPTTAAPITLANGGFVTTNASIAMQPATTTARVADALFGQCVDTVAMPPRMNVCLALPDDSAKCRIDPLHQTHSNVESLVTDLQHQLHQHQQLAEQRLTEHMTQKQQLQQQARGANITSTSANAIGGAPPTQKSSVSTASTSGGQGIPSSHTANEVQRSTFTVQHQRQHSLEESEISSVSPLVERQRTNAFGSPTLTGGAPSPRQEKQTGAGPNKTSIANDQSTSMEFPASMPDGFAANQSQSSRATAAVAAMGTAAPKMTSNAWHSRDASAPPSGHDLDFVFLSSSVPFYTMMPREGGRVASTHAGVRGLSGLHTPSPTSPRGPNTSTARPSLIGGVHHNNYPVGGGGFASITNNNGNESTLTSTNSNSSHQHGLAGFAVSDTLPYGGGGFFNALPPLFAVPIPFSSGPLAANPSMGGGTMGQGGFMQGGLPPVAQAAPLAQSNQIKRTSPRGHQSGGHYLANTNTNLYEPSMLMPHSPQTSSGNAAEAGLFGALRGATDSSNKNNGNSLVATAPTRGGNNNGNGYDFGLIDTSSRTPTTTAGMTTNYHSNVQVSPQYHYQQPHHHDVGVGMLQQTDLPFAPALQSKFTTTMSHMSVGGALSLGADQPRQANVYPYQQGEMLILGGMRPAPAPRVRPQEGDGNDNEQNALVMPPASSVPSPFFARDRSGAGSRAPPMLGPPDNGARQTRANESFSEMLSSSPYTANHIVGQDQLPLRGATVPAGGSGGGYQAPTQFLNNAASFTGANKATRRADEDIGSFAFPSSEALGGFES